MSETTYNSCEYCEHETNDIAGTPCESCIDGSQFAPTKPTAYPHCQIACATCVNANDDEEDVGAPCYYCIAGNENDVGCKWLPRIDISVKDCATCTQRSENCTKCESFSKWEQGRGCITCVNRGVCINRQPYENCREERPCWISPYITENKTDNVNHPSHYISNGLETIDVIEAFCKDLTGMEAVCTANAIKYICRWKHKNGAEDLKKANWYISKLISILEENDDER